MVNIKLFKTKIRKKDNFEISEKCSSPLTKRSLMDAFKLLEYKSRNFQNNNCRKYFTLPKFYIRNK